MPISELPSLRDAVLELATGVGRAIRDQSVSLRRQTSAKPGVDLVTAADHLSEERLVAGLERLAPGTRIVAEEGSAVGPDDSDVVWYVDPLDGTCNFSRGLPFWAVSVGLVVAGEPVLGVVVGPECGIALGGARGHGAQDGDRPLPPASPVGPPRTWVVASDWPWDLAARRATTALLGGLAPLIRQYKTFGSAALDKAQLARGGLDAYAISATFPWDQAGGAAILAELGYELWRWDATPWIIGSPDIACLRPGMHETLAPILAAALGS